MPQIDIRRSRIADRVDDDVEAGSVDMLGEACNTPGCQPILPDVPGCVDWQVMSDIGTWLGFARSTSIMVANP